MESLAHRGGAAPSRPRVRLLEPAVAASIGAVEQTTLGMLKEEGEAPLDALAERVASELYREELRQGGWVVDLGLVGSELFIPEIIRSLKARDGVLWRIITDSDRKHGLLSDFR
jgi:hypothetical protein